MALNTAQANEVWSLFSGSPLFAGWPGAASAIGTLLEPVSIPNKGLIYQWDDGPTHLYLITQGSVEQTVRSGGKVWLSQQLGPGEFFGQVGLASDKYQASAVAAPGAVLYRMSAAGLGQLIDRNPALREELLHDGRASRLRRIPLFRSLNDARIRWLAQITQERTFAPNASLPLEEQPGLWIIDWGQVMVTGPANPHSESWDSWGISAGNFCIAPGVGLRWGGRCAAQTARISVTSRLFYLPAAAVDRLVAVFPDVGTQMVRPTDIAGLLEADALFGGLSRRQQEHLAQFAAWEFVPAGQNVTTQGGAGHNYVIVRDGSVVLHGLDDRGRLRPKSRQSAPWAYGGTSLRVGNPRDATVRAVAAPDVTGQMVLEGAEVVLLDRRDAQYAFASDPDLWGHNVALVEETTQEKEKKKAFAWLDQGETVRWAKHPHILWLLMPEAVVLLMALGLFFILMRMWDNQRSIAMIGAGVMGIVLLLTAFLIAFNYHDDWYVLTNRRISRRDRQFFFYDTRIEAPLDMVQDVTLDATFWGRLFGWGEVMVRTASNRAPIDLTHIPEPEQARTDILIGRTEAKAAEQAQQIEMLRSGLVSGLQLALPEATRTPALGPNAELPRSLGSRLFGRAAKPSTPKQEHLPGEPSPRPQWMTDLSQKLPADWGTIMFGPEKPQPSSPTGQVIWRKHPIVLLVRAGIPALLVALFGALGIALLANIQEVSQRISPALLCVPLFAVFVGCCLWLAWEYVDYRNDIYVLTDKEIIDIERKPLGIDMKKRQGGLERVQNVEARQRGILSAIFDYGDVVISTAAEDEGYTFNMVPHPKRVQALVFQKLDAFRRQQNEIQAQQRQRELIEGLRVYDQVRSDYSSRGIGPD